MCIPVQCESARNRRQVKRSRSMFSAGDVTAARSSVPFFPVFTSTSTCDLACVAREVRSPPHRCRLRVEHVIPVINGCRIPRALDVSVHPCELLHQGGMRLTVCALLLRVCRVGWSVNGVRSYLHPSSPSLPRLSLAPLTGAAPRVSLFWWRRRQSSRMWTGGPSGELDPRATHRTWPKPGCPTHYRQVSVCVHAVLW